jgi:AraC family carnitine catabolism transcriptional activator
MSFEMSQRHENQAGPYRIGLVLVPEFSLLVVVLMSELLRIANLAAGRAVFETRLLSVDGNPVKASSGNIVSVNSAITPTDHLDAAIICASYNPLEADSQRLRQWLRRIDRSGTLLGGIDTGTLLLASAGLLDGKRATLHWDEINVARELFPAINFSGDIVDSSDRRLTGSGSLGAIDFTLSLVSQFAGEELATKVLNLTLDGRTRSKPDAAHPIISQATNLMRQNLDCPLSNAEVARRIKVSVRQLNRVFSTYLGKSPGQHYNALRLGKAKDMLTRTGFSIAEIAAATGFSSASWFSQSFKSHFGLTPSDQREKGAGVQSATNILTHGLSLATCDTSAKG